MESALEYGLTQILRVSAPAQLFKASIGELVTSSCDTGFTLLHVPAIRRDSLELLCCKTFARPGLDLGPRNKNRNGGLRDQENASGQATPPTRDTSTFKR